MYIARNHDSHTHMWGASTLASYLDFLKIELKRKRHALNLPFSAKGLVLCDAACVHSCSTYEKLRERFEREANALLIHGGSGLNTGPPDHRVSIPGGWGACGAPNDAWHQFFHYLRRGWMRACVGMGSSTYVRRALQDMDIALDGHTRMSTLDWL